MVLCGDARYLPGQVGIAFCRRTFSCVSAFGDQTVGISVFFFFSPRDRVQFGPKEIIGSVAVWVHSTYANNRNEAVPYLYDPSGTTRKVAANPCLFPRLRMPQCLVPCL